jgi:hypothetical protein
LERACHFRIWGGMPRYFFNTHGVRPSPDTIGEELRDDEAAWHEATLVAGEIFKDIDGKFRPDQQWSLEVTDEKAKPLYSIHISSQQRN